MTTATSGEQRVSLVTIARHWLRLGFTGFGGPPAHIAMLRKMCVEQNEWLNETEFEDAIATTNLLPGPASTQLAIYCAWKLRGAFGAILGGLCFIVPGLLIILGMSWAVLAKNPPLVVLGLAAGAGAVVPAVALSTSVGLVGPSRKRMGTAKSQQARFAFYVMVGAAIAASSSPLLVLAIIACGVVEIFIRRSGTAKPPTKLSSWSPFVVAPLLATCGLSAIAWAVFKLGALSYGGGFVIIPLMQHDAVSVYHWMTGAQFLNAVALGQVTPGPVVQTVAVVGYVAHGVAGALLASAVAFSPSFVFILLGARHFHRIRTNPSVGAFLTGAGPTVIGAIAGSVIPLSLALSHGWQVPILVGSAVVLSTKRQVVVRCFVVGALLGLVLTSLGFG